MFPLAKTSTKDSELPSSRIPHSVAEGWGMSTMSFKSATGTRTPLLFNIRLPSSAGGWQGTSSLVFYTIGGTYIIRTTCFPNPNPTPIMPPRKPLKLPSGNSITTKLYIALLRTSQITVIVAAYRGIKGVVSTYWFKWKVSVLQHKFQSQGRVDTALTATIK